MNESKRQIDEELFTPYERGLIRCLRRAKGRSAQSAACAIQHLRKAWKIRSVDPEMALFRAISSEEEAATALFIHLKERKYIGAKKLNHRSHTMKLALTLFLREFYAAYGHALQNCSFKVRVVDDAETGSSLDLVFESEGLEFRPANHPLEIAIFADPISEFDAQTIINLPNHFDTATVRLAEADEVAATSDSEWLLENSRNIGKTLSVRMQEGAKTTGAKSLNRYLAKEANLRNQLLYAGSEGWPGGVHQCEKLLSERRQRVSVLLTLYCLLFPHRLKGQLVQQALLAFAETLELIDFSEIGDIW